jgi:hypothetical protein
VLQEVLGESGHLLGRQRQLLETAVLNLDGFANDLTDRRAVLGVGVHSCAQVHPALFLLWESARAQTRTGTFR